MINNYWTAEDNELIKTFHGTNDRQIKESIFNHLLPKFNHMIGTAIQVRISGWSQQDKEEVRQDCLLKIWQVLCDKLDDKKLQGVLNFLWVVVNNQIYTIARQHNLISVPDITYNSELLLEETDKDYIISNPYKQTNVIEDEVVDYQQIRMDIMNELDRKILAEEKVNRTMTVYLILLKEYLIHNDYDSKGFQTYVCDKMDITRKNFYQINFKLGMRCQVFNDKQK